MFINKMKTNVLMLVNIGLVKKILLLNLISFKININLPKITFFRFLNIYNSFCELTL